MFPQDMQYLSVCTSMYKANIDHQPLLSSRDGPVHNRLAHDIPHRGVETVALAVTTASCPHISGL